MDINTLKKNHKDFIVFSLNDIRKNEESFHRTRLSEWQKKGYIRKIIRGYYIFKDLDIDESTLFLIANRLYSPSYISFEIALSYYQLIPESVYGITSATSKKTYSFDTELGTFFYRKLKPELFFGHKFLPCRNQFFKMADMEKSILDYLYVNPQLHTKYDFFELRLNKQVLIENLNRDIFDYYLKGFNNRALEKRVSKLFEFLFHD